MWQDATAELLPRTFAVVSSLTKEVGGREAKISAVPQGSGFLVCSDPVLIVTNEHVITDDDGNLLDDLRVGPFGGEPEFREVDGAQWNEWIDLAVLRVPASSSAGPVTLWAGDPLSMGTPVASLGFPVPQGREIDDPEAYGIWQLTRRLSTGHVSQAEYSLTDEDGDKFPEPVYEMNTLIYGGNSGGPCFDREGRVVGVVKSSLESKNQTTAFSYAIRSDHLIKALEALDVGYVSVSGE